MSHVAEVDLEILDMQAMQEAVEELGLEWREGQATYKWFGRWVGDYHGEDAAYRRHDAKQFGKNAQHAIRDPEDPDGYEIGVVKSPDRKGSELLVDEWGSPRVLQKAGGKGMPKLRQRYTEKVALKQLRKTGHRVVRRVMSDGSIVLTGTK